MSGPVPYPMPTTIITAEPGHVAAAVSALSGHMDTHRRDTFHDKLRRYARKTDRALFLARKTDHCVGFSMVIHSLSPPGDISPDQARQLQECACGTGLMVLKPWRGRGVGRRLVEQWEIWARAHARSGLWCVTHRMGAWYRNCLGYRELERTWSKGVVKTLMIKRF